MAGFHAANDALQLWMFKAAKSLSEDTKGLYFSYSERWVGGLDSWSGRPLSGRPSPYELRLGYVDIPSRLNTRVRRA